MKKLYTLIFCVSGLLSMNAQLTQTNHAPAAADTYTNYQCDSLSISPGANGAGVTWNFSSVVVHTAIPVTFAAAASTNASYPAASVSVASTPYGNTYFYNSSATSLDFYGGKLTVNGGGTPVSAVLNYTQPAKYAAYPMSLNTTATSTISGSINVTSPLAVSGTFSGTCDVLVSGSGTLSIGTGSANTYTNVLKVVTSQTMDFVTTLASGTLTQINYEYFSSGTKSPIFSISTATAVTPLGTNTQTFVNSVKPVAATTSTNPPPPTTFVIVPENTANAVNISVYPNPANTYVNVSADNTSAYQVAVYDITGKLVDKQVLTEGKVKVSTAELQSGLYIYTVTNRSNEQLKTGKLTINH